VVVVVESAVDGSDDVVVEGGAVRRVWDVLEVPVVDPGVSVDPGVVDDVVEEEDEVVPRAVELVVVELVGAVVEVVEEVDDVVVVRGPVE
jgi:hypothetical protein